MCSRFEHHYGFSVTALPVPSLSFADIHEAIAQTRPDQDCIVFRDRRLSWADVTSRTRRLANYLISQGLGCHTERSALAGHESGQDHLAIYMYNCNEYLESMIGAFKARVAPFNVNYRYVAEELLYLLTDSRATAIVVQSQFAPLLQQVRKDLPLLRVVIQIPDDSGNDLLPDAVWYEDALASVSDDKPAVSWSGDDLYILYTGGTTGMPKGVLWRNADAVVECFGGEKSARTIDEFLAATAVGGLRTLPSPPFMHGAGHWVSFRTMFSGGTVFIQSNPDRLDPHDVWSLVEREKISFMLIVGDAFGRPLLDGLAQHDYDLSSLTMILSGGAALSAGLKNEFLAHLPSMIVVDGLGSSEAGGQLAQVSAGGAASTGTFPLGDANHVLSEDLTRVLSPGDPELGWLVKSGNLALGYLGDDAKTRRTYPEINGVRYAVPGDRARLTADGLVELHGRDSVTINSGGEKIFAEEVEAAVKAHAGVYDCVVAGRPSERWGNEVVAIVRIRDGYTVTESDLLEEAQKHVARYKLPKAFVFVDSIMRSPAGKADYRWAKEVATSAK